MYLSNNRMGETIVGGQTLNYVVTYYNATPIVVSLTTKCTRSETKNRKVPNQSKLFNNI